VARLRGVMADAALSGWERLGNSVSATCQKLAGVRVMFRHFRHEADTENGGKYG
jgi:hypothetical protein